MKKKELRKGDQDPPRPYRSQSLRSALSSTGRCDLIPESRTLELRDILFRDVYGLPPRACIRIAVGVIRSYLSIFGARCGWQSEVTRAVQKILERIEEWLQTPDGRAVKLLPLPETPLPNHDQNFTNAIDTLCKMVRSRDQDAGRLAARTEWLLWCCMLQRMENVWAADDPLAAAADRARSEFRELACCGDSIDSDRDYELRVAAQCHYLRGRELEDNLPAAAAQWREWQRISDLLQIEIERYPEPPDPVRARMDVERSERNEFDDDL